MTTEFVLVRWKSEGLRCPDHEIRVADDEGKTKKITLVQMPNGTGKTTTLRLLRAALSGEAADWQPNDVRSLRKKEYLVSSGTFLVECLVDEKRLTIVLKLDFENGVVSYTTTFNEGKKKGFHPPPALRRFLKKDFVRLFIFDGEQAEHLLDRQYTNANDAIDTLFQLRFFGAMQHRVEEYWNDHMKQAKAGDDKGLARRRNRVDFLNSHLEDCRAKYAVAFDTRRRLNRQLETKKRSFKEELRARKDFAEELRKADQALAEAKSKVQLHSIDVFGKMRDVYALLPSIAVNINELRANLDRVKLPESTAREFFEELADEESCVCGRNLDDECRHFIRNQASKYLGSDDVALLNAMKSDIADQIGEQPEVHSQQLFVKLEQLRADIRNENLARTVKDQVESKAIGSDPELEKIGAEIEKLEKQSVEVAIIVEKYESTDDTSNDEQTFGVSVLERRLKDAERKLAEITQTIDLRKKRDTLISILDRAHTMARSSIGGETVSHANERIASLMPSNAIRIKAIDNCLVLSEQEGGSMGETLSVAYAFLATFFNSASNQFPFVVDSPAGSIDLQIRPRIAELVPKLTKQFVAFTISSERQGFSDRLRKEKPTFVTLFRKGNVSLEKNARTIKGYSETNDGIVVPGQQFFEQFQVESE